MNALFSTEMAAAPGVVAGSLEVELAAAATAVVSGDNMRLFRLHLSNGSLTRTFTRRLSQSVISLAMHV